MDEEQRAEAKKASNKGQSEFEKFHLPSNQFSALKSRTKKARNDLLTNGKKSSRKLEKTQMQGKGGSQAWDWEETGNHGPLDVIAEEAAEAPADNPLVSLD